MKYGLNSGVMMVSLWKPKKAQQELLQNVEGQKIFGGFTSTIPSLGENNIRRTRVINVYDKQYSDSKHSMGCWSIAKS
jgi:hypothetical protein